MRKYIACFIVALFLGGVPVAVQATMHTLFDAPVLSAPVNHAFLFPGDVPPTPTNLHNLAFQWRRPNPFTLDMDSINRFTRYSIGPGADATARINYMRGLRCTCPAIPPGTPCPVPAALKWATFPQWYDIRFINRSLWGVTPTQPPVTLMGRFGLDGPGAIPSLPLSPPTSQEVWLPPAHNHSASFSNFAMDHSSLYEIRIEPGHFNIYYSGGVAPDFFPGRLRSPAPRDTAAPAQHIIMMTDIRIRSVQASGSELIVEWFNPSWGNVDQSFFDEWVVSWRQVPLTPTPFGLLLENRLNQGHAILSRDQANLTVVATPDAPGRTALRAHISTGVSLIPTTRIEVRVEPRHARNNVMQTVRLSGSATEPGSNMWEINGVNYFIAHRGNSTNNPFVSAPTLVSPRLQLNVVGEEILLSWCSLAGMPGISEIRIMEEIDNDWRSLGGIAGTEDVMHINQFIVARTLPREPRTFKLLIFMTGEDDPVVTNTVRYDPAFADFFVYSPTIISAPPTEAGILSPFRFMAFTREPFTDDEAAAVCINPGCPAPEGHCFDGQFLDRNVFYRLFVADNPASLNALVEGNTFLDQIHGTMLYMPNPSIGVYEWPPGIMLYQRVGEAGVVSVHPLTGNRTYHIALQALRLDAAGDELIASPHVAFFTVFLPPIGPIQVRPVMITAPPLRVTEPVPPGAIPLEWDLRYLEMAEDVARWHGAAGRVIAGPQAGQFRFGRDAFAEGVQGSAINEMLSQALPLLHGPVAVFNPRNPVHVSNFLPVARGDIANWFSPPVPESTFIHPHPIRIQDMTGNRFEVHTVALSQIQALFPGYELADAYEAFRLAFLCEATNPASAANWHSVNFDTTGMLAEFTITHANTPPGPVRPNTAYIVYFRPYRLFPPVKFAFLPTYVVVTTPNEPELLVPDPTTPVLQSVPEFVGMTTIGVRWRIVGGLAECGLPEVMTYDLRRSEFIGDFSTGGTAIPWSVIVDAIQNEDDPSQIRNHGGAYYIYFQIPGLFADTNYYVWATATNNYNVTSAPSNPVEVRTLDIEAPLPPIGLGRAPAAMINLFNQLNNASHDPQDPYALHISWTRTVADRNTGNPRATTGVSTGGTVLPLNLPLPQFNDIHVARVQGLLPNREYFIRGRTIFTLQRGGPPQGVFSYEIWIANNEDFLDPIIFITPPLVPPAGAAQVDFRRAESIWVYAPPLFTAPTGEEYDGAFRPEQFPLPDYDWEITLVNGTLLWRFRTTRTGADGRPDQQADQRFISRLIDSRAHRFIVDLSQYTPRPDWPVHDRELLIPLSIIRAFDQRHITLEVNFGEKSIVIPPGAFNTAAVRNLSMGIGSYVRIAMLVNPEATGLPALPMNNRYTTLPQRLLVQAITPSRTLTLNEFARPVEIHLQLDDLVGPDGVVRAGLFHTTPQTGRWQDAGGMTMQTQRPVTVAAVTREAPRATAPQDPTMEAMERVTANLTFTDMFEYNPRMTVNANAFNNVMNALANNANTVTLNATLSAAQRQSLQRGRFLAPENLTWEAAVDILVRFYELRTRHVIQPMTTPQMVIGLDAATPAMRQNILKAADIGFFTGRITPQGALTMGDLMSMLDIILMNTVY
ncbi:MAG: hypothetical protein FWB88_08435 [Defluviitaleaceae bacterium]|nr:hypothetical protein [Defluviitaleaceae bacterium]MCL2239988.1 hypothetical protein [Defluviitaleaceae bacterium]